MAHALFPGTFDPPTLGHLDVLRRALAIFGRVTVGLADHPSKEALFSVAERQTLLEECAAGLAGVDVQRIDGLVVDACARLGCEVLVRGVRGGDDFAYEARMAGTNRALAPRVDTVLLPTAPELSHVTGTLVRQIARLGGDVSSMVPEPVLTAVRERFGG